MILLTSPTSWLDCGRSWHVSCSPCCSYLALQLSSLADWTTVAESLRLKYLWMLSSSPSFFLQKNSKQLLLMIRSLGQHIQNGSSLWYLSAAKRNELDGSISPTLLLLLHDTVCSCRFWWKRRTLSMCSAWRSASPDLHSCPDNK